MRGRCRILLGIDLDNADVKMRQYFLNSYFFANRLWQYATFLYDLYTIIHWLALPFTETLFALSLATHHHATPASVSLNVTSHLWLRPVLFIAEQLKCEGSQWQDKYKSQRAGGVSQTKARITSFLFSQLSS